MATLNFIGKYSDLTFEIDDEDLERVSQKRWLLSAAGNGFVISREMVGGKQTHITLHRFLMQSDRSVFFRDGNPLNCRKANLTHDKIKRERKPNYTEQMRTPEGDVDWCRRKTPVEQAVEYLYTVNKLLIRKLDKAGIEWLEEVKALGKEINDKNLKEEYDGYDGE